MTGLPPFFADCQDRVTTELRRLLAGEGGPVERAMGYTALAPSKQVRAVLVLLCAELCRGSAAQAAPAAAAIELVHASSLILDDLPSMDDAPLRRGRRANHLESGEAIAILAASADRRSICGPPISQSALKRWSAFTEGRPAHCSSPPPPAAR